MVKELMTTNRLGKLLSKLGMHTHNTDIQHFAHTTYVAERIPGNSNIQTHQSLVTHL